VGGVRQDINVELMPKKTGQPCSLGMVPQDEVVVESYFRDCMEWANTTFRS